MLLDYYKLAEDPFGVTPDPRFLYMGEQHREALASLAYGTESNRGFIALIAKPGMGKTSLLYQYLNWMRGKARTAFVFRTDCDVREFMRHVLFDLGIDAAGKDLPAMHDALNKLLTDEMNAGRKFVLVIDEAQNLSEEVLESVRLLSNFETPWTKLMQIVIAGQPQLAEKLARPSMVQLRQRISLIIRIEPLTGRDVNAYIDHRLWVGGCENPALFTVGARSLILQASEGIPRNVNNICFGAMSLACAMKRKTIDRQLVLEVLKDLDLESLYEPKPVELNLKQEPLRTSARHPVGATAQSRFGRWWPRVAIAGALLLAFGWVGARVHSSEQVPVEAAAASTTPEAAPATVPLTQQAAADAAVIEPVSEMTQLLPGHTLYQISIEKFGKYDDRILKQIRTLNPGMVDPEQLQPGQWIRMPLVKTVSENVQRPGDQAAGALPAEMGKP
jgi:general secretion pathway protein A